MEFRGPHTCDPDYDDLTRLRWEFTVDTLRKVEMWTEKGYRLIESVKRACIEDLRTLCGDLLAAPEQGEYFINVFGLSTKAIKKVARIKCKACQLEFDEFPPPVFAARVLRKWGLDVVDAPLKNLPPFYPRSHHVITREDFPCVLNLFRNVIESSEKYVEQYRRREAEPVFAKATDRKLIPHLRSIVLDYAYGYTPSHTFSEFLNKYVWYLFRYAGLGSPAETERKLYDVVFYAQMAVARQKEKVAPTVEGMSREDRLLQERVVYMAAHPP